MAVSSRSVFCSPATANLDFDRRENTQGIWGYSTPQSAFGKGSGVNSTVHLLPMKWQRSVLKRKTISNLSS